MPAAFRSLKGSSRRANGSSSLPASRSAPRAAPIFSASLLSSPRTGAGVKLGVAAGQFALDLGHRLFDGVQMRIDLERLLIGNESASVVADVTHDRPKTG